MRRAVALLDLLASAALSTGGQVAIFMGARFPDEPSQGGAQAIIGGFLFLAVGLTFAVCAIALSGERRSAWLLQCIPVALTTLILWAVYSP